MSSTFIYLDTKDCIDPSNPAFARFLLNFQNYSNHKGFISLEQLTIPITVSPINSNNNTLELIENSGATTATVTLSEQSYTGAEIATELKTKLDAASLSGNIYTVSYNSNTKKLTIAASANNFTFGANSTALKVIGFTLTPTTYSASRTSENVVRLDGSSYYDIVSSLSSRNISSNGRTNILARVPIFAGFGSVQSYQHTNDSAIQIFNQDVDVITLSIYDDENNLVQMPEGSDIAYTFKLTFE